MKARDGNVNDELSFVMKGRNILLTVVVGLIRLPVLIVVFSKPTKCGFVVS